MEQYGDMMVGKFRAGMEHTTLQTLIALRWYRQFCPPTPFLVQAYDSTFMTLNKLGDIINSFIEGENTIIGLRRSNIRVLYDYEKGILFFTHIHWAEHMVPTILRP